MKTLTKSILPLAIAGSLIAAPARVVAGDKAVQKKSDIFSSYTFVTNGNTNQLNIEGGRRKLLGPFDLGFGFSYSTIRGDDDYMLNLRLADKIGQKISVEPYILSQGSLNRSKEEDAVQSNLSYGFRAGADVSKSVSLGLDLRFIDYTEKKRGNTSVYGIFAETNF